MNPDNYMSFNKKEITLYNQDLTLSMYKLKQFILICINELKGQHIVCLDVHRKFNIAELMIFCTGLSNRHVNSIARNILQKCRNTGFYIYGIEGLDTGEWVLVDLGDILIHIMQQKTRALYELEKLWS